MKGVVILTLAIIGTGLLFSCKKDGDDLNVAEKIIGKWVIEDCDGEPALTNDKVVLEFVSASKAFMSTPFSYYPAAGKPWIHKVENEVAIDGNTVTLTGRYDQQTTTTTVLQILYLSNHDFTARVNNGQTIHYTRVGSDYSVDIIGTWQGRCTSQGSAYDDGQEHRWQYLEDGTYVYYVKDGDQWVPGENTVSDYFVAGNLLCTRWENSGQENHEWWGIAIEGNRMNWSGLRKNEKGETIRVLFQMRRVQEN